MECVSVHACVYLAEFATGGRIFTLHDKKVDNQCHVVAEILKVVSACPDGGALTQLTTSLTLSPDSPHFLPPQFPPPPPLLSSRASP